MSSEHFVVREHTVPGQYIREYADAVRDDQETILRLHVKQYTPRRLLSPAVPSITILAAHGNGFPKETYEALWDELLAASERAGFGIHGIWIADVAHQGQSYVLNEQVISDDISWFDHPRDLLHITNQFRDQMPRPIVGIGHSMGGAHLAQLASIHPRLMTGLVLLDPVIEKTLQTENPHREPPVTRLSTYRRDVWPSREEASVAMQKAPMLASWDDRAWAAFVKYGLRDLPTAAYPQPSEKLSSDKTPVTLTTPKTMEVHTFMRANFDGLGPDGKLVKNYKTHADVVLDGTTRIPYPFYRPEPKLVYERLPSLRPAVLFVLGGTSFTMERDTKNAHKITGTAAGGSGGEAEGKVKQVVLENVGHGIPFDAPALGAEACAYWLVSLAKEWRSDQRHWLERRKALPAEAHVLPTEEWKKHIGLALPRGKSQTPQSKI